MLLEVSRETAPRPSSSVSAKGIASTGLLMTEHRETKNSARFNVQNRREFYRARASLEVYCRPICDREREWMLRHHRRVFPISMVSGPVHEGKGLLKGELVDVGGGGMKFSCYEPLSEGSFAELTFEVPGPEPKEVLCVGRVVRVEEAQEGWHVAVEFSYIRESDRDRIVRLTFHPPDEAEAEEPPESAS